VVNVQNVLEDVRYEVPREHTAEELRSRVRELVRKHIDGEPGFFVLTGTAHLDADEAAAFTMETCRMVGELLPQDAAGALLREVVDRGVRLGEGKTGRYSDSRQGGSLHTDGPHGRPPVPDCFALYCIHQAPVGGDLCLVHVDDLIARLGDDDVAALRSDFHFDRREDTDEDPTVVRPVLSQGPGGTRICYLREYIELGHEHDHVPPLTAEQRRALDALDALLDDESLQTRVRLEPGELAFIDNRTLLHGRTAFEDDSDPDRKRLMLRTWIHRPELGGVNRA
jgi:alpha-ketoglutarate-dependent taurine dioxygenase